MSVCDFWPINLHGETRDMRWLAFPIWFCIGVFFLKVSRCRSLRPTWRSPLLIDFHALWKHVSALCQYIAIREVLQFVAVSSEQLKFLYFVIACFYLLLSYFLLFQSTVGSAIVNKKKGSMVNWYYHVSKIRCEIIVRYIRLLILQLFISLDIRLKQHIISRNGLIDKWISIPRMVGLFGSLPKSLFCRGFPCLNSIPWRLLIVKEAKCSYVLRLMWGPKNNCCNSPSHMDSKTQ